jgi:hypothetical protein
MAGGGLRQRDEQLWLLLNELFRRIEAISRIQYMTPDGADDVFENVLFVRHTQAEIDGERARMETQLATALRAAPRDDAVVRSLRRRLARNAERRPTRDDFFTQMAAALALLGSNDPFVLDASKAPRALIAERIDATLTQISVAIEDVFTGDVPDSPAHEAAVRALLVGAWRAQVKLASWGVAPIWTA